MSETAPAIKAPDTRDAEPKDAPASDPGAPATPAAQEPSPALPTPTERLRLGRVLATVAVCVAIVVGAIALAIVLKGSRSKPPRKPVVEGKAGVRVVEVRARTLKPAVTGLGRARPRKQVAIAAEVPGRLLWISPLLEDGAHIDSGTVIARIDPADAEATLAQAEAQRLTAYAEVRRLEASESFLHERVALAQQTLALEEADLKRVEDLSSKGINSDRELDVSRRAVLRNKDALITLQQTEALLGPQLAAARARVAEANARLRSARLTFERTTVRAPFPGQASKVAVEADQRVNTGQVLFELWAIDTIEIPVVLPLAEASLVSPTLRPPRGDVVTVHYEEQGQLHEWSGRIERFEPVDPETQTVRVLVLVNNPSERALPLSPGMFCSVRLQAKAREVPLALPLRALQEGERVYLVRDEKLAIVDVVPGRRLGRWVEITKGLVAGDLAIVSPLERAIAGSNLTVVAREEEAGP